VSTDVYVDEDDRDLQLAEVVKVSSGQVIATATDVRVEFSGLDLSFYQLSRGLALMVANFDLGIDTKVC